MSARSALASQLRLPLRRDLTSGEARFARAPANAAAMDAVDGFPAPTARVMALCGPAGCGKSHLAALWAERVGAFALNGAEAALIDPLELEGRPLLLDIAQDADDESLFHLINLAQGDGGALLLVSRPAPRQWSVDLPDLRSRLDALPVAVMEAPDDAVLTAMLEARFAEHAITPQADVIPYLLRRMDRSAAAAADVVARLDQAHAPVTRALARQVLNRASDDEDDD